MSINCELHYVYEWFSVLYENIAKNCGQISVDSDPGTDQNNTKPSIQPPVVPEKADPNKADV